MELLDEFLAATEGMTQEEAAERTGIHQRTISRWRNPKTRPKSLDERRAQQLEAALQKLRRSAGESGPAEPAGRGSEDQWGSAWEEILLRESRASENRAIALRLDAEATVREAEAAVLRARAMAARAYATTGVNPSPTGDVEPAAAPGLGAELLQLLLEELKRSESLRNMG